MRVAYGVNSIPATAVFMNTIELSAQYAELDWMGRTRNRHGIVLSEYPQVEIALLAAGRGKGINVRLAIWGLYGALLDMVFSNRFIENEIELIWDDQVVASLFFTQPLDADTPRVNNDSNRLIPPLPRNLTDEGPNTTPEPVQAGGTGSFDWKPIFTPSGKTIPAKDVFLIVMGSIKALAPHAMTDKVMGAFHVNSKFTDANMQAYLQNRRVPRTSPPFFQFAHVLEAVRRVPAWMLAQRKFAEFACRIEVSTIPVGSLLIEKGPFVGPSSAAGGGDLEIS